MPDPITYAIVRTGPTNKAGQRGAEIVWTDGNRTVSTFSCIGPEFATVEAFADHFLFKIPRKFADQEDHEVETALEKGETPNFNFQYGDANVTRKRIMRKMMNPRTGLSAKRMARLAPILENRTAEQVAAFLGVPVDKATAFRNYVLAAKTLVVG
jgi:hypothetical protein